MNPTSSITADTAPLQRRIGIRSAVLFNILEMIGVGPFIALPLVIAAAGYRLSVWAWVLGATIAVADGLVWAELGAAFPRAGGSYAFLREIYGPNRAGNWLSFLYVWQVSFTAPLSIASGCIGLSSFLAWFWPTLDRAPFAFLPAVHYSNFAAAFTCLLVVVLLYRNMSSITRLAWVLFAGVLTAIAGVIVSGFTQAAATGGWQMPVSPGWHRQRCSLRIVTGATTISAFWAARCASRSGRSHAPFCSQCSLWRRFMWPWTWPRCRLCAMPHRTFPSARRFACNWWLTLPSPPLAAWPAA
jgi:amino acid transporter